MNMLDELPNDLKVAVWDTYIKKKDGNVMHFDIIVPENFSDEKAIFNFGETYAKSKGELDVKVDTSKCQFCHVEDVTNDVREAIAEVGYYILEMDDIPGKLPDQPSKRDLVLFIKGHFKEFRFSNFSGVSVDILKRIIDNRLSLTL